MKIPKIIHQIWWQGKENLPNRYKFLRKSWLENHKSWSFIIWSKSSFEKLLDTIGNTYFNSIYNSLPIMIQKIDFAKYVILNYQGGCYVDMDTISEKPLDNLISNCNCELILSQLDIYKWINFKLVNNGIIFSTKNHPFYKYLFHEIYINKDKQWYQNDDWYIMDSTGPIAFSRAILNYSKSEKILNLVLLEDSYLESCKMSDFGECISKGKYITHIHDCSWGSKTLKYHFKILKFYKNNISFIKLIVFIVVLLILYLFVVKKNISI
jgi:mannosyltransferase OCH1-like enzyme|uniref:Glycosyltransferase n=1 Tax=viral metagenome TaxID=1070528 RepID=A0A6C0LYL0_9ZZZZ